MPTSIPSSYGSQRLSSIWQSARNNEQFSTPNVIFSYYPFLKLPGLRSILAEDLRYLNAKGCLHIPGREALDEFMRNYFLYVHPCLPLLDEADFWRIYRNRQFTSGKDKSISLFTFQAMLFASCSVRTFGLLLRLGSGLILRFSLRRRLRSRLPGSAMQDQLVIVYTPGQKSALSYTSMPLCMLTWPAAF